MKRTALIFDLDGTLVDSAPDLRMALNVTLRELHRREVTLEEVRHMIGDGTRALVERALAATGSVSLRGKTAVNGVGFSSLFSPANYRAPEPARAL